MTMVCVDFAAPPGHSVEGDHRAPCRPRRPAASVAPAGHRSRWRLQPRTVAGGRLGRGRRTDAAGRGHLRDGRRLLVGPPRTGGGALRVRLAGPGHGPAPRGRDPRGSRDGDRLPPPWLSRAYPETLPVDREGRRLWPGGRQAWCPSSPVFRDKALALVEAVAGRYAAPPGPGDVARLERAGLPQRALLLRHLRRGLPALAARPLRRRDRPQRRLGNDLLEPALLHVRRGPPSPARDGHPQPDPAARLRTVQLRRAPRVLPGRARRPPPDHPGRPGDDELHGHVAHDGDGLLVLGSRDGPGLPGPLPRPSPRGPRP